MCALNAVYKMEILTLVNISTREGSLAIMQAPTHSFESVLIETYQRVWLVREGVE